MEIDIQPPSDVYETFGRLNYTPWHAIAEFVDNATQNFAAFRDSLRAAAGGGPVLTIGITYDSSTPSLVIADDAHGMNAEEFSRAIRLSARPADTSGRSEFGMGLKTAAFWFGTRWTLRSTRLGEDVEYSVTMDVQELIQSGARSIGVAERKVDVLTHGTTLEISPLRKRLYGRQIKNIKDTLASMYRQDLQGASDSDHPSDGAIRLGDIVGSIQISWNGEPLSFAGPDLFTEELPDGTTRTWRHAIDTIVVDPATGTEHAVTGWVGILKTMSSSLNGFALMRRGRVIIGGPNLGWRPTSVLGSTGSHSWKRLVGELHLDSFPVSFTKDGFPWEHGLEEQLEEVMKREIADYRMKAQNLRTRETKIKPVDLQRAADSFEANLDREGLRRDLARLESPARTLEDPVEDEQVRDQLIQGAQGPTELKVAIPQGELVARLYLREDDPRLEWLTLSFAQPDEVDVFLNVRHPFVAAHVGDDASIAMLSKFALALALAEKRARMLEGGKIYPDDLRTHLDTFLKHLTS